MVSVVRCCLICLVFSITGCFGGPGSTEVKQNEGIPATELLRQDLKSTAETGQLGSEQMLIESHIELLSKQEPDKAAELSKDLKDLAKLSGSAAKSKAKSMIDKL